MLKMEAEIQSAKAEINNAKVEIENANKRIDKQKDQNIKQVEAVKKMKNKVTEANIDNITDKITTYLKPQSAFSK